MKQILYDMGPLTLVRWSQNIFGPKIFMDPKYFRTQNIFGPKIFSDLKFLGSTFFSYQRFFGHKIFFGSNISFDPKFCWTQNFLD